MGEVVEIYLEMKVNNKKYAAILFTDGVEDFWIPRSLILNMELVKDKDYNVEIPVWFAEKEGMV